MRLTPVMFEAGARPHPPRELYQAYLAQSDLFVGLYWQRYGRPAPGMDVSGLEEEFELSQGLPRLLYVKTPAPDREPRLGDLLARIKAEAAASYRTFRTAAELGRLVRDDLAALLSERFAATRPALRTGPVPRSATRPALRTGPVPRSATRPGPRPLPVETTTLIGRERAIDELVDLLARPEVRLVTLTGPGGIGKTRLAMAAGARLLDKFAAGTAFVSLAEVTTPEQVLTGTSRAVGAELAGTGAPLLMLVEYFGGDRWLLILDNLERVVEVATDLSELLARCPGLAILATSRTVLGLRAEREYQVPPLSLPPDASLGTVGELAASAAISLFVDRARAIRKDFALTAANAPAVVEIVRLLEGVPLAIELAAARTRLLDPDALLVRLSSSLDALGTGPVDLPERQRTLRATVEWSVGLLDDAERSLLEHTAVFVNGWTVQAVAQIARVDEDRALELTEALARHSLIYLDSTDIGPRSRMLETVRAFVAERLAARPDVGEVHRRHANFYRALADQADRPVRGMGQQEWAERLEAEAGNLAAAVRWHLANDRTPLPHLFRILWPYWFVWDHVGEARAWVEQLLPAADTFDLPAQAELLWAAGVMANEVGDDQAALAACARLAPLLDGLDDPFLQALCHLALAWTAPITDDFDGALREAALSLDRLRGQDEPYWTALAAGSLGTAETALGHYDSALTHLREAHTLAEQLDNAWLAGWSRVQLGDLALVQGQPDVARTLLGQPDVARTLLEDGLALSVAARSSNNVALSLAVFARLALAEGDPEQAALLAGAVDGLRRRVGLQAWPALRRPETRLATQLRQTLGDERFDAVFAAGSLLSRREAVAAASDRYNAKGS